MKQNEDVNVPKMPIQVGDSDQYVSGIIEVTQPMLLVEITVRDVHGDGEWRVGPVPAPAPFEDFVEALNRWRASLVYPAQPKVRTRTLDPDDLESYCLRYRQAYELMGDGNALKAFRTQLWQEWKEVQTEEVFPTEHGKKEIRRAIRRNFNDALDAYLRDWKANKEVEPYSSSE